MKRPLGCPNASPMGYWQRSPFGAAGSLAAEPWAKTGVGCGQAARWPCAVYSISPRFTFPKSLLSGFPPFSCHLL